MSSPHQFITTIMASSTLFPILITLTTYLILTTPHLLAQAATPVAPGPTPASLNLTAILDRGGQYTTFMRLLKDTQVGVQIQSQLNNSFNGLTIFAPTDNAFNNLKPGTLNSLTSQEQVALVLYHVLPRYYSIATFQTASNPVPTQASGHDGVYTLNVTSTTNQVNVSTGVDETQINNELHSDFPLAVYSVDEVLLPYDLFGAKPPASAPAPNSAKEKPEKSPVGSSAEGPSSVAASSPSAATSLKGRGFDWSFVAVIGLMGAGSLL